MLLLWLFKWVLTLQVTTWRDLCSFLGNIFLKSGWLVPCSWMFFNFLIQSDTVFSPKSPTWFPCKGAFCSQYNTFNYDKLVFQLSVGYIYRYCIIYRMVGGGLLILLQKSFSLHYTFALLEANFHFMLSIYQLDHYVKSKHIIFFL